MQLFHNRNLSEFIWTSRRQHFYYYSFPRWDCFIRSGASWTRWRAVVTVTDSAVLRWAVQIKQCRAHACTDDMIVLRHDSCRSPGVNERSCCQFLGTVDYTAQRRTHLTVHPPHSRCFLRRKKQIQKKAYSIAKGSC